MLFDNSPIKEIYMRIGKPIFGFLQLIKCNRQFCDVKIVFKKWMFMYFRTCKGKRIKGLSIEVAIRK
jgi:hypothetical protein